MTNRSRVMNQHLCKSSFLGLTLSLLILVSQANSWERSKGNGVSVGIPIDTDSSTDDKVRDILEYPDFEDEDADEDDDSEGLSNMVGFNGNNVNSVTHFHRERGEILVPCFGMWWPVGGGPTYDYGGDYYEDYRKRRRRSKKRKKAAKMKKKKS